MSKGSALCVYQTPTKRLLPPHHGLDTSAGRVASTKDSCSPFSAFISPSSSPFSSLFLCSSHLVWLQKKADILSPGWSHWISWAKRIHTDDFDTGWSSCLTSAHQILCLLRRSAGLQSSTVFLLHGTVMFLLIETIQYSMKSFAFIADLKV